MSDKRIITTQVYASPFGNILLGSIGHALCLCEWHTEWHSKRIIARMQRMLSATCKEGTSEVIAQARHQLEEYFAGERRHFDIALCCVGTDFQRKVWNELQRIPYGQTITYAQLANRIGKPTAYRAVANANNANHLSVMIPCHRVIGSNHTLTGYGGGLYVKQKLLELESASGVLSFFENR